jgi:hypothetical protein
MNKPTRSERVRILTTNYEKQFAERGGILPSDPLEFHLYHLALYWSRLTGFCRHAPSETAAFIDTDLGVCVEVGSEFTHKLIGPDSLIYSRWQNYWKQTQAMLHNRQVTIEAVESASKEFDACLAELKYDPWPNKAS